MALDASQLASSIEQLAESPGADAAGCAALWADAMRSYAAGLLPTSTSVGAAADALEASLAAAFAPNGGAAPLMETAFATFASTLAVGMAPAFVATPPPIPVGFAAQFAGAFPETHAEAGQQIGGLIDTWMRVGTATPSGGGAPIPWN